MSYLSQIDATLNSQSEILDGEREGFLYSLMLLSSMVIQADGKIMHSEMEFVRNFVQQNYGEQRMNSCNELLLKLYEERKKRGSDEEWQDFVFKCAQRMKSMMNATQKNLLIKYLTLIAQADGHIDPSEVAAINSIANWMDVETETKADKVNTGGDFQEL